MKQSIMSYKEIQYWLPTIQNKTTQLLITTQYATGCRIGELIEYKHKNKTTTKGLRYERITEHPTYWELIFPCFKQRKISYEPAYISKKETFITNILEPHFKKHEYGQVFPFKETKARNLIKKEFHKLSKITNIHDQKSNTINKTFSSHNLRATRITHLINPPINMNLIEAQKQVRIKRIDTIKEYYNENFTQRLNKF